jgi:hypothetical protein
MVFEIKNQAKQGLLDNIVIDLCKWENRYALFLLWFNYEVNKFIIC